MFHEEVARIYLGHVHAILVGVWCRFRNFGVFINKLVRNYLFQIDTEAPQEYEDHYISYVRIEYLVGLYNCL